MENKNFCEYSIEALDDGQQICPKHVECFTKIKLRNSASCWLLLKDVFASYVNFELPVSNIAVTIPESRECMYVSINVCTYVCMYVYTYIIEQSFLCIYECFLPSLHLIPLIILLLTGLSCCQ
jgi:hypothetical protein